MAYAKLADLITHLYWRTEQLLLVFDVVLGHLLLPGLSFLLSLFFPLHSVTRKIWKTRKYISIITKTNVDRQPYVCRLR